MTEREGQYDVQVDADTTVTNHVHAELEKWQSKAIKHNMGTEDQCNCPNCMKTTMSQFNSALDMFLGAGEGPDKLYEEWHLEIGIDEQGKLFLGNLHQLKNKDLYDTDSDTGLSTT